MTEARSGCKRSEHKAVCSFSVHSNRGCSHTHQSPRTIHCALFNDSNSSIRRRRSSFSSSSSIAGTQNSLQLRADFGRRAFGPNTSSTIAATRGYCSRCCPRSPTLLMMRDIRRLLCPLLSNARRLLPGSPSAGQRCCSPCV